jgi:hypothetical protein
MRGRHTRRWHVTPWTLLLVAAMGALVFLAGSSVVSSLGAREASTRAESAEDTLRSYAEAVAAACERDGETARALGGLCHQPVPEPGERGRQGKQGPQGPQGPLGPRGPEGPEGPQGPEGPEGEPGTDGEDGTDGVDGADGKDGADGADGERGPEGPAGPPGADGQPPESFTFTDSMGREQTCVRDEDSPDTAPTYTCTPNGTR